MAKMLDDYIGIFTRSNDLPITKIGYRIDAQKILTIRIIRDHDPLNLTILNNFRLKMLGFSEWIEDKKVGLPPPPQELATFGMSPDDKKRKRTKFLKEMFVTKDIRMDGMNRNLTPPTGIILIDRLFITEPKSRIFFMHRNTNVAFQRESEFHLTPTVQLIRI
ncbi:hypothetical protein Tco_1099285 [Tanacetum coccineum]